jgi:lipase maturation factor 1
LPPTSRIATIFRRLLDPATGDDQHFLARWFFLRALGLIYFSAFFSLLFQIRGLIGPAGILPAGEYLARVAASLGALRFWFAPTLLWFSAGPHMLMALCWAGLIAALLATFNLWPRLALLICLLCFLSFVSAAQDFSEYQSDGMLLEAGFLSLFLAPGGLFPGWGLRSIPLRASRLLLLWEWFRIYFESGVVKLKSGDPTWRNLTAIYDYYQNGPLPTWIGWYLQHLPHWFQKATAGATLAMELAVVFLAFLPRRWRIVCFCIVTAWQIGVILTANYCFLNYLVLALGVLLLDDRFLVRFVPARWRRPFEPRAATAPDEGSSAAPDEAVPARPHAGWRRHWYAIRTSLAAIVLLWIFYAGTFPLLALFWPRPPLPTLPVLALEPFRIANQYGLFAVMTPARYEIEFQGSNDGTHWTAYPFRYKPQDPAQAPGIYAPYQPRFDWNLWFASLGSWTEYPIVPRTEELLLTHSPAVLTLFAGNPFPDAPPRYVRAVLWQYWFSTPEEKRSQHLWWTRQLLGAYAPVFARTAEGRIVMLQAAPAAPTPTE